MCSWTEVEIVDYLSHPKTRWEWYHLSHCLHSSCDYEIQAPRKKKPECSIESDSVSNSLVQIRSERWSWFSASFKLWFLHFTWWKERLSPAIRKEWWGAMVSWNTGDEIVLPYCSLLNVFIRGQLCKHKTHTWIIVGSYSRWNRYI